MTAPNVESGEAHGYNVPRAVEAGLMMLTSMEAGLPRPSHTNAFMGVYAEVEWPPGTTVEQALSLVINESQMALAFTMSLMLTMARSLDLQITAGGLARQISDRWRALDAD